MTLPLLPFSAMSVAPPNFFGEILLDYSHALTIHRENRELYLVIIVDDTVPWYTQAYRKVMSTLGLYKYNVSEDKSIHRFVFVPILHSEAMDLAANIPLDIGLIACRRLYIMDRPFADGHDVGTWTMPTWLANRGHILTPSMLQTHVEDPIYMDARVTQWLCSFHSHPVRGSQCHCGQVAAEVDT